MLRHTIITAVRDKSRDITITDTSELVAPLILSGSGDFVAYDLQFSKLKEWLSSDKYVTYSSGKDIILKLMFDGSVPRAVRSESNFVLAVQQHYNSRDS